MFARGGFHTVRLLRTAHSVKAQDAGERLREKEVGNGKKLAFECPRVRVVDAPCGCIAQMLTAQA